MIEEIISNLYTNVKRIEKSNHNRHSSRFVGSDMYPQIGTCGSWQSQTVEGITYQRIGELWATTQVYKFVGSNKRQILTLSRCILVESVYISIVDEPFTISIGDLTLDIESKTSYYVDIQRVLYPGEGYEVTKLATDEFSIEINYRELL